MMFLKVLMIISHFLHSCSAGSPDVSCENERNFVVPLHLVLFGAPGAGKSFSSANLEKHYNVTIISSGNMLREIAKNTTDFGKDVRNVILSGKLVQDEFVIDLIRKRLATAGPRWVLDGFPRTLYQAEELQSMAKLDAVINLNVRFDELVAKLANRRVHLASGRTYNLLYKPPLVTGKDDITGEPIEMRPDDNPQVTKVRLQIYHEQSEPILKFYRNLGLVKEVLNPDGSTEKWPIVQKMVDEILMRNKPTRFRTLFDGRRRACSGPFKN